MRYKAVTPSQDYGERTLGVKFDRGVAYFDDITIDKGLGLSAEEIARRMELDFGYEVQKLNDDGTPVDAKAKAKQEV